MGPGEGNVASRCVAIHYKDEGRPVMTRFKRAVTSRHIDGRSFALLLARDGWESVPLSRGTHFGRAPCGRTLAHAHRDKRGRRGDGMHCGHTWSRMKHG